MKLVIIALLWIISVATGGVLQYVDPFIGTGGEGYGCGCLPPGAQIPFGLVRLGPDTSMGDNIFVPGWSHTAGYHYFDDHIRTFSHTHLVGAGVPDFGNIGVMVMNRRPDVLDVQNCNYYSQFSHDNETAEPGFYSVYLQTPNAQAELTATHLVGAHRYTFLDSQKEGYVLIDAGVVLQGDGNRGAFIEVDIKAQEVRGWILNAGFLSDDFGGLHIYFVAKFDRRFITYGTWNGRNISTEQPVSNGSYVGAFIHFDVSQDSDVELFVGISLISINQARKNLVAETNNFAKKFDDIRQETQTIWENALSKIQIKLDEPISVYHQDQLVKFYTAFYHTMLAPTDYTEQGGLYIGFDLKIHNVGDDSDGPKRFYSDMSIWDTFRTEHPWLALIRPQEATDVIRSMLMIYKQAGYLPKWPLAFGETDTMIGTHAQAVIADAYAKGIRDFNLQLAYEAMYQCSTQPQSHAGRTDLGNWSTPGYVTSEAADDSAPLTEEYAFDDWCVAKFAEALGYESEAKMFYNRSQNYRNTWSSQHQIFCPRSSSGEFDCPVAWDNVFDERYVEGDAWHWRWFVPHDVPGLIELFGSTENFLEELTFFFDMSEEHRSNFLPDPYFWAGNEHDLFAPYLFAWASRLDLTQKYARWNLENRHGTGPDGIPGILKLYISIFLS